MFSTQLTMAMPFMIPRFFVNDLSDKFHIVMSNINVTKIPYVYDGKEVTGAYFIPPGVGMLSTGIGIMSMGHRTSISCSSDEAMIADPQELIDIFTQKNDEMISKIEDK